MKPNFTHAIAPRRGPGEYLLALGRLTPEKGFDTVVTAARDGGHELIVAGDGPARKALQTMAGPKATFVGAVGRERIPELLSGARALVFPSRWYEGSPRVVLEAFAAGVGVIGSRIGGIPELLSDPAAGVLVPPEDRAAWATAFDLYGDDEEAIRAGRAAHLVWQHRFSPADGDPGSRIGIRGSGLTKRLRPRSRRVGPVDSHAPGWWTTVHRRLAWIRTESRRVRASIRTRSDALRRPLLTLRRALRRETGGPLPAGGAPGRTGLLAVNDPFLEGPLWLRIGSTDINVAGKILLEREYELPLARDPRVIVDAGAYTGISSRWFAARYPNATIVALEPGAANFELLRRNVRQETRIVSVREALWCKDELVSMTEEAGDGAWALRVANHGSAEPVRATTVTALMQRLGLDRIDLLKLDIEGSEVEVFQSGARHWLP